MNTVQWGDAFVVSMLLLAIVGLVVFLATDSITALVMSGIGTVSSVVFARVKYEP